MLSPPLTAPSLPSSRSWRRGTYAVNLLLEDLCFRIEERLLGMDLGIQRALITGKWGDTLKNRLEKTYSSVVFDRETPNQSLKETSRYDLIISFLEEDSPNRIDLFQHTLKDQGVFLGIFFGGATLAEMRHIMVMAEDSLTGRVAPRFPPLFDLRDACRLLEDSGLAYPVADKDTIPLALPSFAALVRGIQLLTDGDPNQENPTPPRFTETCARFYTDLFKAPHRGVRATIEVFCLYGKKF